MSDADQATFEKLCDYVKETALLQSVQSLVEWDQQTLMPEQAGEYRAEQIMHLAGLVHQRNTAARLGDWLGELAESPLASDPHSDTGATIRELKRTFDKESKVPQSLVEALAQASSLGQQAWIQARKNGDFASFQPQLQKIINLKRQQALAVGYDECPYDALLDDYEPGAKTSQVAGVLESLRKGLVPLVAAISESRRRPDEGILTRHYPAADQEVFGKAAAAAIGFDFTRGRLDVTAHPFCCGVGPRDCRITTRYDERFFSSAFFGILHEAGHGIYDQGLRDDWYGLPPGKDVSLGIHESQSRLWENFVGRSREFWEHFYPPAQQRFTALRDVSLDDFYFAINAVKPSLIRVEADEATYNLHIIIRFELEQALINDDFNVADLPAAWNEKYQKYLGIQPPSDTHGVLQDVHWSAALIGYFPTYSLGNLYAAQFFAKADQELGGLQALFAQGEFAPLKEWLGRNIHRRGQCYAAEDLGKLVTGEALSHEPLVRHLRAKLEPLYGI